MALEDQRGQMSELQLQQMQAMLTMAQGGMGMPGMAMPGMPPADHGSLPGMPPVDPNMAQAYLSMFQYLTAQGGGAMGMPPPMPFPGMASPYAPAPEPQEPTVAVSVEGMKFQYQLTEDDLHKVFSRYGGVKNIRVDEVGAAAQITFHGYQDAQAAMNDLNGKVLNGLEGTLRINWVNQNQGSMPPPYPSMPFPAMGGFPPPFPGAAPGWPPAAPGGMAPAGGYQSAANTATQQAGSTKGVRKYTCRFIIGIENDKEFQVARRVIGAKGANMKRVVQNTEGQAKLRLRGQGSGYFEGAGQKESSEPLQLCISCTNSDLYKGAVQQVEELLKRVYDEYRAFCREKGKLEPDVQINFSENQLVYSANRSGGGGGGPAALQDDSGGENSPQQDRKTRRSRMKGSVKMPSGDDDRGEPGPNAPAPEEIEKAIDMRNEARRACNFAEADRLREHLHSRGVALMDEPGGRGRGTEVTTWRYWRD